MKKNRFWLVPIIIVAAGISIVDAEGLPAAEPALKGAPAVLTREQLELRLDSVKLLIESSSAARQIDTGGNPSATELRIQARDLHAQAVAAFQAGDMAKAAQWVEQASRRMFQAVRLAAPEHVTGDKKHADFTARLDTVSSLLTALKRIGEEKKSDREVAETIANIDAMVRKAKQAESTDIDSARIQLDKAYLASKLAVEKLREGDTLVRSLKFATKSDEYRYEVDRNDSHLMLIKMLVQDKQNGGGVDDRMKKSLEEAAQLRISAENFASNGDYESAISTLEQSTSTLVRAIRVAGVYIPG